MSFGRCTSKMCLGTLSGLFCVAAVVSFVISGYVIVMYNHYDTFATAQLALVPASFLTFVGVMFQVAGFIGCWAMCRENKCVLCSFFFALLLILTLLITSVSLSFVYKGKIGEMVANATVDALEKYGPLENRETVQVDFLQMQMQCCGFMGYTDWASTPWGEQDIHKNFVPWSCCKAEYRQQSCNGSLSQLDKINTDGCYAKWKDLLLANIKPIAIGSLIFTVALVFGMISSCSLLCYKRKDSSYTSLD